MLHRYAVQAPNGLHDRLAMLRVGTRDGHVTHHLTALDAHEIDRAKDGAGLADRAGD